MTTRSKRTRGAAGDATDDHDLPLHMDPSLMTERQQLAFLLRKTAQKSGQDAAPTSSSSSGSESSDDDAPTRRAPKKARRGALPAARASPKSPPPASREDLIAAALKNPAGLVLYCGRGRPPKNAIKLAPGEEMPPDLKRLVETAASHLRTSANASDAAKELRVKTDEATTARPHGRDEDPRAIAGEGEAEESKRNPTVTAREKTSPSSMSELSQHLREVYDEHRLTPCALCCGITSPLDAPLEALFLCPTCDRKYPTQRALGLV